MIYTSEEFDREYPDFKACTSSRLYNEYLDYFNKTVSGMKSLLDGYKFQKIPSKEKLEPVEEEIAIRGMTLIHVAKDIFRIFSPTSNNVSCEIVPVEDTLTINIYFPPWFKKVMESVCCDPVYNPIYDCMNLEDIIQDAERKTRKALSHLFMVPQ